MRFALPSQTPIRKRFMTGSWVGARRLTTRTLRRLTTVDYVYRLALAAVAPDGTGVAIARYEGNADSDIAEVAVVVAPAWRRVGLASGLLRMLANAALDRGIHRFAAISYADNIDVQDILARSGLPLRQSGTKGVIDTSVELGAKSEPIDAGQSEMTDPGA